MGHTGGMGGVMGNTVGTGAVERTGGVMGDTGGTGASGRNGRTRNERMLAEQITVEEAGWNGRNGWNGWNSQKGGVMSDTSGTE